MPFTIGKFSLTLLDAENHPGSGGGNVHPMENIGRYSCSQRLVGASRVADMFRESNTVFRLERRAFLLTCTRLRLERDSNL
jgi:hypothetical protein